VGASRAWRSFPWRKRGMHALRAGTGDPGCAADAAAAHQAGIGRPTRRRCPMAVVDSRGRRHWRHCHLCRVGETGICNFTAPECLSQAQFSRVAAAVLRRPYGFPTPGLPIRMALGEQTDLLLKGQRVAPEQLKDGGFVFRYPRLDGALRSSIRRCSFAT
jgi:hypothetical protein